MEQSLSGRDVMGNLAGTSDEIRRTGGPANSSMNDYVVCIPVLAVPAQPLTYF